MFHARIVSPNGSMYFAAEVTPYDLENLRTHVHDFQSAEPGRVRVELSIDGRGVGPLGRQLTALVDSLMADGVQVRYLPQAASGHTPSSRRASRL